jgi:hypothetical protein
VTYRLIYGPENQLVKVEKNSALVFILAAEFLYDGDGKRVWSRLYNTGGCFMGLDSWGRIKQKYPHRFLEERRDVRPGLVKRKTAENCRE